MEVVHDWTMHTERLTLRPLRPDDAELFAAYRNHDDVARHQDWDIPFTIEAAQNFIAGQAQRGWPSPGDWLQIAVEHEGRLAGDVGAGWSGNGRRASIGYTLAPDRQGRGLATEAVAAVVDRLLADDVRRIDATLDPDNVASMRLLERLGFEYEGQQAGAALVRGEWLDDVLYGLTPARRKAWVARDRTRPAVVELREITAQTAGTFRKLATHHSQERMVATVAGSYEDALFPGKDDDGGTVRPWFRGIYADGEPVGFVMVAGVTATNADPYLWRLLIDGYHQERGIGTQVVAALVDRYRAAGCNKFYVSWMPGPGSPGPFYERLGFAPTGEMDEDEVVAALDL
ncbi:MAG: GNAT family N-acetyltransferase [Actinomycetota bacterium]|nr:GNAT family N-acetyltransferase [Actinomycetota bacterium]